MIQFWIGFAKTPYKVDYSYLQTFFLITIQLIFDIEFLDIKKFFVLIDELVQGITILNFFIEIQISC